MSKAILQTGKVSDLKHRHGCVIFSGNKILAVGHNKRINIPSLIKRENGSTYYVTLHAEVDAILKLHTNCKDISLLVVRYNKNGLQNSYPCNCCMATIIERGVNYHN